MKLQTPETSAPTIRIERIKRSLLTVKQLWSEAIALEQNEAQNLEKIFPGNRKSAQNLIHYLAVRRHDIRDLPKIWV